MLRTLAFTKAPWRNTLHTLSLRPSLISPCTPKSLPASARYIADKYLRPAPTLDLIRSIRRYLDESGKKKETEISAYIREQLKHWLPRITRPSIACEKLIDMLIDKDCAAEAKQVYEYMIENGMNVSAATQLMFASETASSIFKEKKMKAAIDAIGKAVKAKMSEEEVNTAVSQLLDQYLPRFKSRADLFEGVIFLLVKKHRITEASVVYERMMNAGFVASSMTDARLMTLSIAMCEDERDAETFMKGLNTLFHQDDFTGNDILELIYLATKFGIKHDKCAEIIEMYIESRPEDEDIQLDYRLLKKLISSKAASGNVEGAINLLNDQVKKGKVPSSPKLSQHMYAELLGAIRYARPNDRESITTVLDIMKLHRIKPGVAIFNNLVASAVRRRSIQDAFLIYQMMKDVGITPDAFTYGSLWNAITELYSPLKARRNRRRDVIITPRNLYREMISTLIPVSLLTKRGKKDAKLSNVLTTNLLDVTLRAFLSANDYTGAFVVVRSFFMWHVQPGVKTYNVVFRRILGRLNRELKSLRQLGESRWADRYLGLPDPIPVDVLSRVQITAKTAEHLLNVVKRPDWALDAPPYVIDSSGGLRPVFLVPQESPGKPDYIVPTRGMTRKDDKTPDTFSHVPIERMLRRAILADNISRYGSPSGAIVSQAIQEAKKEMIPETAGEPV